MIEYLHKENRALREQLGGRRFRFSAEQRRRLAVKAKEIGRKGLFQIETLLTPDTLFTQDFRGVLNYCYRRAA